MGMDAVVTVFYGYSLPVCYEEDKDEQDEDFNPDLEPLITKLEIRFTRRMDDNYIAISETIQRFSWYRAESLKTEEICAGKG